MRTTSHVGVEIRSPAKVNLFLEILGRRPDGFHEIDTVMSTVSLFDTLRFRLQSGPGTSLRVDPDLPGIPTDRENLVLRALEMCASHSPHPGDLPGISVELYKRIPAAAGLGGASGNAAAAIRAADRLWDLQLTVAQQHEIAASLGSDVPFFLEGGAARCTGRGEKTRRLTISAGRPVVIATPPQRLSTADVYQHVIAPGSSQLRTWTQPQRPGGFEVGQMFNRLEAAAERLTPWVSRLKREFGLLNPLGHQLSGSGSSYFGVFGNVRSAGSAAARLRSRLPDVDVFCVRTTARTPGSEARQTPLTYTNSTG